MVEKLSVQIALEGGQQIEQQLAGIGEAGTKAFADISKAAEAAGGFKNLKPEEVTEKLKAFGDVGAEAFKKIQDAVKSASNWEGVVKGVEAVESGFAKIGQAAVALAPVVVAAGAAIVTALSSVVTSTIETANAISKVSAEAMKLGLTIEQFDRLRLALEQAGIASQAISSGFAQIKSQIDQTDLAGVAKNLAALKAASAAGGFASDARELQELRKQAENFTPAGTAARKALVELGFPIPGTAAEDVRKLGTEIAKLKGLTGIDFKIDDSAATRLQKIIEALELLPAGALRTAAALQFLGDTLGTKVIQALDAGGAGLSKLKSELGLLGPDAEKAANSLEQSINKMMSAWNRFSSVTFAPTIAAGIDRVTKLIETLNTLLGKFTWANFAAAAAAAFDLIGQALQKAGLTTLGSAFIAIGASLDKFAQSAQAAAAAAQQAGQAGAQAGQQATEGWDPSKIQVWNEALGRAVPAAQQAGQAAAAAGQQATSGWDPSKIQVWNEALGRAVPVAQQAGQAGAEAGAQAAQGATEATSAWNAIVAAVQGAGTAIATFASSLASIAWDSISSAGVAAWNAITGAIGGAIDALLRFIGLKPSTPATGSGGGGGGGLASGGFIRGPGSATSDSIPAWLSRGEFVINAAAVKYFGKGFFAALNAFKMPAGAVSSGNRFAGGGSVRVAESVRTIVEAVDKLANNMDKGFRRIETMLADLAKGTADGLTQLSQQIAGGTKKAQGGLLGGRGTGTSDSNLAWVSRGEHIMPARAVRQPGVLAFLEALRRSGGNLARVLDGMGRFALGGMVPRAMPAFAAGGLAGGMSNVTIQFPGLPPIGGLRAPAAVVDELRKAAAMAQVRSGGRKPSRYS